MQSQQQSETACSKALEKCIQLCRKCKNSCMVSGMPECASTCEVCMMTCAALLSCCQTKCYQIEPTTGSPLKKELMAAVIAACMHCAVICESHDHAHCKACAKACLDCVDALESTETQTQARSYSSTKIKQAASLDDAINTLKNDSYGKIGEIKFKKNNTTWIVSKDLWNGDKYHIAAENDFNPLKSKSSATVKELRQHVNYWK